MLLVRVHLSPPLFLISDCQAVLCWAFPGPLSCSVAVPVPPTWACQAHLGSIVLPSSWLPSRTHDPRAKLSWTQALGTRLCDSRCASVIEVIVQGCHSICTVGRGGEERRSVHAEGFSTHSHTHPQGSCCASCPQKVKQSLTLSGSELTIPWSLWEHLGLVLFFMLLEKDAGHVPVLIGLLFKNDHSP